jgi:hypothetical protein
MINNIQSNLEELVLFIWGMEPRASDQQYLAGKQDGLMQAISMITGETTSEITTRLRNR